MQVFISLAALPLEQARRYSSKFIRDGIAAKTIKKFQPIDAVNPHSKVKRAANPYRLYLPIDSRHIIPKAVRIPEEIEEAVAKAGYRIENYVTGIATSADGKQKIRIGKLIKDDPDLADIFKKDPARNVYKNEAVAVISCHPYDIAGMSTGRHWTSCMNLDTGMFKEHVIQDVLGSTLVAYAISPKDTNIAKPKARFLIKLASDSNDPSNCVYVLESSLYGSEVPGFEETLRAWLHKVNVGLKPGQYRFSQALYDDGLGEGVLHLPQLESIAEDERIPLLQSMRNTRYSFKEILALDKNWLPYLLQYLVKIEEESTAIRKLLNLALFLNVPEKVVGAALDATAGIPDEYISTMVADYSRYTSQLPEKISLASFLRTSTRMWAVVDGIFGFDSNPTKSIKLGELDNYYKFDHRWIERVAFNTHSDRVNWAFIRSVFNDDYQFPVPYKPFNEEGEWMDKSINFLVSFFGEWIIPLPDYYKVGYEKLRALGAGRSTRAKDNSYDDLVNMGAEKFLQDCVPNMELGLVYAGLMESDIEWGRELCIYFDSMNGAVLGPLIKGLLQLQKDGLAGGDPVAYNIIRASKRWTRIHRNKYKADIEAAYNQARQFITESQVEFMNGSFESFQKDGRVTTDEDE